MIEDSLRQAFAAQADAAPALDDPAGRAITRARSTRRRRAVSSGLASVVALALVLTGLVSLRGWWLPSGVDEPVGPGIALPDDEWTTPPPRPSRSSADTRAPRAAAVLPHPQLRQIGLDLRVGQELWTVDGERLRFEAAEPVTRVYRVPVGWVYGGAERVWLLRPDGASVELGRGRGWQVSPDGRRLAYVDDGRLRVSVLAASGLDPGRAVDVPDGTTPVALAGDRVVVAGGAEGPFGSVDPAAADRPVWSGDVLAVYGAVGETVAGLVRDPESRAVCLAALGADRGGLSVRRRGSCVAPGGAAPDTRWLSPGGGFLARSERARVVVLNLERTFSGRGKAGAACPVTTVVTPVWADDSTLIAADRRGAVRCRTDGTVRRVPLPEGLDGNWEFVPDLSA